MSVIQMQRCCAYLALILLSQPMNSSLIKKLKQAVYIRDNYAENCSAECYLVYKIQIRGEIL